VERGLLLRRGQRPRDLAPALLAEDEAHLLRRAQPVRVVGAERGHGASQSSAHKRFCLKKQSSQLTFATFLPDTRRSLHQFVTGRLGAKRIGAAERNG
jgi:hypothetical protein